MLVKQVSVFLENKQGRLAEVTKILSDNDINIRALSIADTTDFGILRLIVSDPAKAENLLKENGFTMATTDVIAVGVEDKPGSLTCILNALSNAEVGIEYMYAFLGKSTYEAIVILKVEDEEKTKNALSKQQISLIDSAEIYDL